MLRWLWCGCALGMGVCVCVCVCVDARCKSRWTTSRVFRRNGFEPMQADRRSFVDHQACPSWDPMTKSNHQRSATNVEHCPTNIYLRDFQSNQIMSSLEQQLKIYSISQCHWYSLPVVGLTSCAKFMLRYFMGKNFNARSLNVFDVSANMHMWSNGIAISPL